MHLPPHEKSQSSTWCLFETTGLSGERGVNTRHRTSAELTPDGIPPTGATALLENQPAGLLRVRRQHEGPLRPFSFDRTKARYAPT